MNLQALRLSWPQPGKGRKGISVEGPAEVKARNLERRNGFPSASHEGISLWGTVLEAHSGCGVTGHPAVFEVTGHYVFTEKTTGIRANIFKSQDCPEPEWGPWPCPVPAHVQLHFVRKVKPGLSLRCFLVLTFFLVTSCKMTIKINSGESGEMSGYFHLGL